MRFCLEMLRIDLLQKLLEKKLIKLNEKGDEGLIGDILKLKQNDPKMTEIKRIRENISDEGAIALAEALKENETLRKLGLRDNKISDEGARALTEALKENKSLEELRLNYNKISDEGAIALAEALKENKTLRKLDLRENDISEELHQRINKSLRENIAKANKFDEKELSVQAMMSKKSEL